MNFLLDTNILIYSLQKQAGAAFHDFLLGLLERGLCFISVISRFELLAGTTDIHRSKNIEFLDRFSLLDVTRKIADRAALLFQELRKNGITVDNEDLLLTATVLEEGLALVTTNVRHFSLLRVVEQHHVTFMTRKKGHETKTAFIVTT